MQKFCEFFSGHKLKQTAFKNLSVWESPFKTVIFHINGSKMYSSENTKDWLYVRMANRNDKI